MTNSNTQCLITVFGIYCELDEKDICTGKKDSSSLPAMENSKVPASASLLTRGMVQTRVLLDFFQLYFPTEQLPEGD